MAKILKLTAALATARADAKAAGKAHEADPDNRILRATYLGCISVVISAASAISKADPKQEAKMKKVTETYHERKTRMEEGGDDEEESVPVSTEKSSVDSSEASSSDEEAAAASSAMPSKSEEEEGAAASEEEEEEAIAKAWTAAEKAYAKVARGADAYGVFGPKGVRKALGKATGEANIRAALGALHALPRKQKADAKVVAKVEALEKKNLRADVEAVVQLAKADGRANSPALRAELREMGAKMGAKYLKGFVAKLPKAGRTEANGAIRERLSEEGVPDAAAQGEMMDRFTAGMTKEQKAEFVTIYGEKAKAKSNGSAGRV